MKLLPERDIDNEKRTPGALYRLKNILNESSLRHTRAEKELINVGLNKGHTVLDYNCSSGNYSIAAAKIVGKEGSVQALDLHPTALEIVLRKAKKHKLGNIETIYSEMETGLENESVDSVLFFNVLNGNKNIKTMLDEIYRILKPSGHVLVKNSGLKKGRLIDLMVKDGLFRLEKIIGNITNFAKVKGEFHEI